jgi:uncharacterized protein
MVQRGQRITLMAVTGRIVEKAFVALEKPTIIEGSPSIGLVGAIATEYLATQLNMVEIGFLQSTKLPPVTIIKDGIPKSPIRLYAKDNLVVIVSDSAVPPELTYDIADRIVEWGVAHDAKQVISLGGIAHQIEKKKKEPGVFAIASNETILKELTDSGIPTIKLGFLSGTFGILMLKCQEKNIKSYGFLADADPNIPDPLAAAAVLDVLKKQLNIELDTAPLRSASDKIRARVDLLVEQTKSQDDSEKAYPSLYR